MEPTYSIDPETGELIGPDALPHPDQALDIQARHDRAIWDLQQRYLQQGQDRLGDATRFQLGALGLLQSYRPGGSAALEAGIYNQASQGIRSEAAGFYQRAGMTQPLDLLARYREQREDEAIRRAERAQRRAEIASYVTAGVQLFGAFAGLFGGGSGGGIYLGSQAAGNAYERNRSFGRDIGQPDQGGGGYYQPPSSPAGGGQGVGGAGSGALPGQLDAGGTGGGVLPTQLDAPAPTGPNTGANGTGPSPLQDGNNGQQPQGSPFTQPSSLGPGQQQQTPLPKRFQEGGFGPGAMPGDGPGRAGGPQPAAGPGGAGMPQDGAPAQPISGGMGSPMAPGADRDFSADSFAAAAAMDDYAFQSPAQSMARTDLNEFIADLYENDPFYQTMPLALEMRWRDRLMRAS